MLTTTQQLISTLPAFRNYLRDFIRFHLLHNQPQEPTFTQRFHFNHTDFTPEEYIIFLLALLPHIEPGFLQQVITEALPEGGDYPILGGIRGTNHRGLIPTGETAQFFTGGTHTETRLATYRYFSGEHFFHQQQLLRLETPPTGEPRMSGRLVMEPETIERLLTGTVAKPTFSSDFPATLLQTQMDWQDLVLNPTALEQVNEIRNWIEYHGELTRLWDHGKRLRPGYRALFYGPPGTGKTLTTTLLGKFPGNDTVLDVYRIDLSQIVSKYIGETEKNLERIFSKAVDKQWILFFDEADALFGKRTGVNSSNDRYANQEVSYLLQRIEDHPGLIILASNLKSNIDEAFARRFQSMVYFNKPGYEERLLLWQKSLSHNFVLEEKVHLEELARKYELTGSGIVNVLYHAKLEAMAQRKPGQPPILTLTSLLQGIGREYRKEDKIM